MRCFLKLFKLSQRLGMRQLDQNSVNTEVEFYKLSIFHSNDESRVIYVYDV